jgi:hypothetical protein
MDASNARAVLRKENELVDELIKTSSAFTRGLTGLEADILKVWGDFLEYSRETNKELIGMTDAKLGQNLDAENKLLKKITTSITGTTTIAKFYKKWFEAELKAEKKLLT